MKRWVRAVRERVSATVELYVGEGMRDGTSAESKEEAKRRLACDGERRCNGIEVVSEMVGIMRIQVDRCTVSLFFLKCT